MACCQFFIYISLFDPMAISRAKKQELVKQYDSLLSDAANVVIIKQSGIPVNEQNKLRMEVKRAGGSYQVTKKRLLIKTIAETNYDNVELSQLDGSIALLYSNSVENKFWALKAVNKIMKVYKKENPAYVLEFVWWWFDQKWSDASMTSEMANLPTKEELISKLLRLMKYPVQATANVLDQIAKQK